MAAPDCKALEEAVAFLQLENAFLLKFLQRVWPDGLLLDGQPCGPSAASNSAAACTAASAAANCPSAEGAEGAGDILILAEKQELCAVEANVTRKEIEQLQADGELERAAARAARHDAERQQAAETAKDMSALLALLGLPGPAGGHACAGPAAAAPAQPAAFEQQPPESNPSAGPISTSASIQHAAPTSTSTHGLPLPTAKQLAKADLNGPRLEQFMEGILTRHDAWAARLQLRHDMLKPQLVKVQAALATKSEVGESLKRVDFDSLRIEHSQAEAAVAAASAVAIALKQQVAGAQQHLAEQRAALAAAGAAAAQLQRLAGTRDGQLAQLQADVARVEKECRMMEHKCRQIRQQRGVQQQCADGTTDGAGDGSTDAAGGQPAATILDYMRLKSACAEMSKKIIDWQRKIEVQQGRRRAAHQQPA